LDCETNFKDIQKLKELNKKIRDNEFKLFEIKNTNNKINSIKEFIALEDVEQDEQLVLTINDEISNLDKLVNNLYLQTILNQKYDSYNAIMKIHSGAGGTGSCDWVAMLYRMYSMYAGKNKFKLNVLDSLVGDEAGLKSITFEIVGDNAYGYLKSEMGVHRLVRISPFDSNSKRHTSFASVEVMPEIENDTDININSDDLKIDTYKSGGAGGQYVNKTESAIRITHIPSGIIVACQAERSQIKNRESAMKMLKGKLVALKEQENLNQALKLKGDQKKIEWGSQIRSYVFCPYTMVKDHRTDYETSDVNGVMNGYIDEFLIEYLKWLAK
jgi:peptide chain release factor 2